MGEVVGFVSKSELERVRLIREARAIYDSIFPPTDAIGERSDDRDGKDDVSTETAPSLQSEHPDPDNGHSAHIWIVMTYG
jgi:hypothetical protein